MPLGEICEIKTGTNINKNFISDNPGKIPVINSGKTPLGFVNIWNVENDEIGIASRGTVGFITWNKGKYFRGNLNYSCTPKFNNIINKKYLYYYLKNNKFEIDKLCTFEGIPALNKEKLETLKVIIPLKKL